MNKTYSKNGVSFSYSSGWGLIDEEWGDQISALTFEDDDEGIYMIDIYHSASDRTLDEYLDIHFRSFLSELPFGSKVVDGPDISDVSNDGVLGKELRFTVKTLFMFKYSYINSGFRLVSENCVSFISSQYPKDNEINAKKSFSELVASYCA